MPSGHRPPIPPGYARVALSGTYQGHKWANVFYLALTGTGIVASDLNTLATDIANGWNSTLAGRVPASVVLTQVQIVYVPSVGNEVNGSAAVSHAGTRAGTDIENASSSWVLNWHISAYYRGGHPRWYLPGLLQADVTNGSAVDSGQASNTATSAAAFMADINGYTTANISGVQLGTMSFATGNSWRGTPLFRPFTGVAVRLIVGSQRRRLQS